MREVIEAANTLLIDFNNNIDSINYDQSNEYINKYKEYAEYIYYYISLRYEEYEVMLEHYKQLDLLKNWLIDFYVDTNNELNNNVIYIVELVHSIVLTYEMNIKNNNYKGV